MASFPEDTGGVASAQINAIKEQIRRINDIPTQGKKLCEEVNKLTEEEQTQFAAYLFFLAANQGEGIFQGIDPETEALAIKAAQVRLSAIFGSK